MNRIKDYEKLATDITTWIRDYAITNNIKSLVVGVSGGIDSAVVSTLCAMTGLPVYTMTIDILSSYDHVSLATAHINWLNQQYENVYNGHYNLSDTFTSFVGTIAMGPNKDHIAANIKSRLWMTLLYTRAGVANGIVVGTGNKVEDFGIGFFTKYGDGGVDISPIADLYKTEVRELGRHLGISQDILDAKPTDGLWADGRTDEDQIGATYEELEWAMEYKVGMAKMNNPIRQMKVLAIYRDKNKQNQHKMQPIPIHKLNQ